MSRTKSTICLLFLLGSICQATTIDVTFNGTKITGDESTAVGTGYFKFKEGLTNITLADITSFAFSMVVTPVNYPGGPGTVTFNQLQSFTMLTSAEETPEYADIVFGPSSAFTIENASPTGGAGAPAYQDAFISVFEGFTPYVLRGGVTMVDPSPMHESPEPPTVACFGFGLAGLAVAGFKFRRGETAWMSAAR